MRIKSCIIAAIIVAAAGCSGGTEPASELILTMQNVSGIYYGVTFTTNDSGVVTDQLRRGATLELLLYVTGATDGRLYMPPDTSGCCEQDINLSGYWDLSGNTVTLSLTNDIFMNGMSLDFEQTHLSGETTRDGVTYRLVLAL